MKIYYFRALALLFSSIFTLGSFAYEPKTHSDMSEAALNKSVLVTETSKLKSMGLKSSIDNIGDTFANSKGTVGLSIIDLTRFGADWEWVSSG